VEFLDRFLGPESKEAIAIVVDILYSLVQVELLAEA
jgi:hypothetical protein